jgi:hypothetical protein
MLDAHRQTDRHTHYSHEGPRILRELDIVANRKAQIANKLGRPKTINNLYPILIGDNGFLANQMVLFMSLP